MALTLGRTSDGLSIHTDDWNYSLYYQDDPYRLGHTFLFYQEGPKRKATITARDLHGSESMRYPAGLFKMTLKPGEGKQVIECGAGLGSFIPELVKYRSLIKTPIIIDPANYELMAEMLEYLKPHLKDPMMIWRVEELVSRCSSILDSSKVRLINSTLDQAIREHPEIIGTADIVVDNYGVLYWSDDPETHNHLASLLKDDGLLYTESGIFNMKEEEGFVQMNWVRDC